MNLSQSKVVNFKLPMRSLSDQGLGIASFLRMSHLGNRGGANGQRVDSHSRPCPAPRMVNPIFQGRSSIFVGPFNWKFFAKAPYEDFHARNAVAKSTQVIL